MSKIVSIRPDMTGCAAEIEAEPDLVDFFLPGGFVESLNSVHITGPQMRAAVETIAHIPVRSDADIAEHGRLLAAFASDYGFEPAAYAGMALHARAIAMDRWCNLHDPFGQTNVEAFYEAGARAKLVRTEEGLGFDPEAFAELIRFATEIPY
ncbi:hypothetical protein [Sphingopyxis sp. MSC1_008]|uniref:hypothetical protein n=1 Tax=Sphingopyxis sp. MSC1_008 TaxID=2909265 RepID=UPI0020C0A8D9|nr:hypothetical protein [Sphingopyxis sp. MSC1_008]